MRNISFLVVKTAMCKRLFFVMCKRDRFDNQVRNLVVKLYVNAA